MLFALIVFIALLISGLVLQELCWSKTALFLGVAAAVLCGFYLFRLPLAAYAAPLCVLDIILILIIFKGDINIR
jgi:hypothetical protein